MKRQRTLMAVGWVALLSAVMAAAQKFPIRPIRLVIPFPLGTSGDFLGRTLRQALSDLYKVQVVADNRARRRRRPAQFPPRWPRPMRNERLAALERRRQVKAVRDASLASAR